MTALVRDRASGETYRVRCEYLMGADGGRTIPGLLGIGYEGLGVVSQTATIHATADLEPLGWRRGRASALGALAAVRAPAWCSCRWDRSAGDPIRRSG